MRSEVSEVFSALADDTRRAIYEQLLAHPNGHTATELAKSASVSRQAIVKHLQMLEGAGLAQALRDGREVRYLALARGTEHATQWLLDHSAAWDRRIAALQKKAGAV
ncbi:MAG: metalloregulator ArsR/SmtB family transcription factor [Acidimicrobiales bacterium]